MKAIRISSLFLLSLLLLCGCDPELNHYNMVENNSGYDFWVINESVNSQDSILILDGTEQIIWSYWGIGRISDFEGCPLDQVDVFSFAPTDSIALEFLKDINAETGWEHSILDRDGFGAGTTECRMVIMSEKKKEGPSSRSDNRLRGARDITKGVRYSARPVCVWG